MAEDRPMTFVTGIWSELIYPVATLVERLASIDYSPPTQVLPVPLENGYSNAITVLSVVIIESVISRVKYFLKSATKRKSVLGFIRQEFPDYEHFEALKDVFSLRDAIAHNHMWEAEVHPEEMTIVSKRRLPDYGDRKFDGVLDERTLTSRTLGLNLFPTRIDRSDVVKVLDQMMLLLLFLESKDRNYIYLSERHVMFENELIPFTQISQRLMSTMSRNESP